MSYLADSDKQDILYS